MSDNPFREEQEIVIQQENDSALAILRGDDE